MFIPGETLTTFTTPSHEEARRKPRARFLTHTHSNEPKCQLNMAGLELDIRGMKVTGAFP